MVVIADEFRPRDDLAQRQPDAHGQAALLLIESLIHDLVEKRVLTIDDALSVTTAACEVKEEIAASGIESNASAQHSLKLLRRIFTSFEHDRAEVTFTGLTSEPAGS